MTFLDKGAVKELGTRSGGDALRSVRAKREAEEAGKLPLPTLLLSLIVLDAIYRKSVHWLETLRIRREKIVEAGYHVCSHALIQNLSLDDCFIEFGNFPS